MTERPNGLRAARTARGWSQTDAAREIAALGRANGIPVAAAASLKSLLSRWENGHAVPDPQYRVLLGELFDRSPTELGIAGPDAGTGAAGAGAARLRAALAAAAAVDEGVLALWRQQLDVVRRLDDELGGAGAAGLVRAQVEQLDQSLAHTITPHARNPVAAVLAAAAALAGAQALDRADHHEAWSYYDRSRSAAREAGLPVAATAALAGQAGVLVEIDDPTSALALLGERCPPGPPGVRVRWEAARGLARAAAGESTAAHAAFAAAERAFHQVRVDVVSIDEPAVELADLHRWHGHALATLGEHGAVPTLERALAAGPRSARHRAGLHADLAGALGPAQPTEAEGHAREARALATRIGSERIATRLARTGGDP